MFKQLGGTNNYVEIPYDPIQHLHNIIRVTVQERLHIGYISSDTGRFMMKEHPRLPLFYLLPKI